jgi:hypothetical protein
MTLLFAYLLNINSNNEQQTMKKDNFFAGFCFVVGGIISFITATYVIVPINHVGIVERLGSIRKIDQGFNILNPFLDSSEMIKVGFDTDYAENGVCRMKDGVRATFARIFVDNRIDCGTNNTCYTDLYATYFISDAKIRAKDNNKIVPEDGTIFKYMNEALAVACSKVYSFQLQNQWNLLYPYIKEELQVRVPYGITIIAIRTDPPNIPDIAFRTSIAGKISSKIYTTIINWI